VPGTENVFALIQLSFPMSIHVLTRRAAPLLIKKVCRFPPYLELLI
jgi:hypothetical protein